MFFKQKLTDSRCNTDALVVTLKLILCRISKPTKKVTIISNNKKKYTADKLMYVVISELNGCYLDK